MMKKRNNTGKRIASNIKKKTKDVKNKVLK